MKALFATGLFLVTTFFLFAQTNFDETINVKEVERIERALSSDDMGGRKVFTPGIHKAANYIANEFKQIGLQSLDDSAGYLQILGGHKTSDRTLENVVGMLPGKSKKDEYVIFSAHYDHLGIGKPENGDSIYNGANDDASGTTAVIMMAAAQPFISGAISKTINLPNEATVEEIADSYMMSWELGLKACALYRDGSKLSQPLSNKSDKKKKDQGTSDKVLENQQPFIQQPASGDQLESHIVDLGKLTIDELLDEVQKRVQSSPDTKLKRKLASIVERRSLPAKRRGFTQKAKINGQAIFLRTGEYSDGTLGEIFIDMAKEGATMRSMSNCFAIAISIGLQYGVPLEEFVDKFAFTRFDPAGFVEHPNIKSTTSIVDFIFRVLGYEYLGRTDLVHV